MALLKVHRVLHNPCLYPAHHIGASLEVGEELDVMYVDFSKVFDSVLHRRLFTSCSYSVLGILCTRSLKTTSRQGLNVYMSMVCSPSGPRWFLVPTRQLVGPFLFLLYINDIPEVVNSNTTSALFTDGAKCSRVISNLSECETLQSDLNGLHDWAVLWGLSFNFKKNMKF